MSRELQYLLRAGLIEKIDALPWVSPIVVTRKKQGGIRLCVDLREPNKSVVMDCHPLPHIEELFAEMCNATVFSQIDLANTYHQLPLHEDSKNLTAFITQKSLFRYKRVPFGLASAPSVPSAFQKMMQTVLKDLPGVL